jgi:glyoxylase-like metal-dependent hydrolase (beta-lactamase superfamily II)
VRHLADPIEVGVPLELAEGLLLLRLPLPFALNHVNVYLLEEDDGWTIVDCGLDTPATRQIAIRRIEVTRALFLYVGAGRDLSPAQRTLLAAQRSVGRSVPDAALARIEAALAAKSTGEAALAAIAQLGPDPSALSFSNLADLMTYLTRAGLGADADAIALEALQVWKAI